MGAPLHICTVIGARPQIIKSAALSRAIQVRYASRIIETVIHTGQHYDANLSQAFFEELGIPAPAVQLEIGTGSPSTQTARIIEKLDTVLRAQTPDLLVVYGDTTTTLAATIAAGKLNIPVAHIEAGLRSYDRTMPEELNRVVCDHCSTWLFCPTSTAVENLKQEGIGVEVTGNATPDTPQVYQSGDIMLDNTLHFAGLAKERSTVLKDQELFSKQFLLATVHRAHNTDDTKRLNALVAGLIAVQKELGSPLVFPLHPRTADRIEKELDPALHKALFSIKEIRILPPVGFLDIIALEEHAAVVLTDSGGVQKEAYFFGTPCVILRDTTEWVEIVNAGRATLADADPERIVSASKAFMNVPEATMEPLFGDGNAAQRICEVLLQ